MPVVRGEDGDKQIKYRRTTQIQFEQLQRDRFTGGNDTSTRYPVIAKSKASGHVVWCWPCSFPFAIERAVPELLPVTPGDTVSARRLFPERQHKDPPPPAG